MRKWTDFRTVADVESYKAHGYNSGSEHVRADMVRALYAYADDGAPLGGFLQSVVNNDFLGAVRRADGENYRALRAFSDFLLAEMPSTSYGWPNAYDDYRASVASARKHLRTVDEPPAGFG